MIVFDSYESYLSTQFEAFCKEKNIITFCFPSHSSHLIQFLDVGCFNVLKRMYGKELEDFIRAHINHITKPEFFIAFKAAHLAAMTSKNIKAGFRSASLILYDPQAVLSKLDIKLRTLIPTRSPTPNIDPWILQTPYSSAEAISQSEFVWNRINIHQGSSPTSMFSAIKQLAKGTEIIAYELTLVYAELRILRKANEALVKCCRAKRIRFQAGGAFTVEDVQVLFAAKVTSNQEVREGALGGGRAEAEPATQRHCSSCGKPGHNIRTC